MIHAPGVRCLSQCLLVTALLLAAPVPVANAASFYRSIETDDLRLVYPGPTFQFLAPYTARCFLNSMAFQKRVLGFEPSEKITVIVTDPGDYGNAGVWCSPWNTLLVEIAPTNFVYETGPSNERINFLMSHELVHITTADQAAGADHFFRTIFQGKVREDAEHPETLPYGYLTLPRRAAPRWFREGLAVFFETWMAGGLGRAQGPWDEMVFRAKVLDGTPIHDPFGLENEAVKTDFQVGVNSYLYGTRFLTYLAHEYSPEHVLRWGMRTPGSSMYFSSAFRQVFGKSLDEGWRDWIRFEQKFQRANLDSIRRYPVTPYHDLSARALGSVSRPCFDPATRTLYAGVQYPGVVAHITAIPIDGERPHAVCEVKGPALYFVCSLARDPELGTLFYTTDNNEWRDLCSVDPASGKRKRLIRDARVGDLAFNPRDRSLWGVRHLNGISSIMRIPAPYTEANRVYTLPYGQDAYDLDISPDGAQLAASWAEINGRQTLRLMDLHALEQGDTTTRVLHDFGNSIPTSFVFSGDGGRLYGSSYYTGVSNIFRYDLAADSMALVSNALTGFFRPLPLGGDSLIVLRYSGEGFVPAALHAVPIEDANAIVFLGAETVAKHPEIREWRLPSPRGVSLDSAGAVTAPYRAAADIRLAGAYPIVEGYKRRTAVGLKLDLADPLSIHRLDGSLTVSPDLDLPVGERWHSTVRYRRSRWTAEAWFNPASFYDLVGSTQESRKGAGASLVHERMLVRDDPRTLDLAVELSGWTGLERLPDNQNIATSPGFEDLLSAKADLVYKHTRSSIGSIDAEKGHRLSFETVVDDVHFIRNGHEWWEGFPRFSGTFGYSPGDPAEPFANFYFGSFGNNGLDRRDPKQYRQPSRFPGIPIDAVGGTNYVKGMIDWNLPAWRFHRAGVLPLFASWARASLFSGALATNLDAPGRREEIVDAGLQTDLRLQLLTHQPFTLSFGYARAFPRDRASTDEWMLSLKVL